MKNLLLCCTLLMPLAAAAVEDTGRATAVLAAAPTAGAERQLAVLEPTALSLPRDLAAPAQPATPSAEDAAPGWREQVALLGAALLALLFILRRQWSHRLGEPPRPVPRSPTVGARRARSPDAGPAHGFPLSQFQNLPPSQENAGPPQVFLRPRGGPGRAAPGPWGCSQENAGPPPVGKSASHPPLKPSSRRTRRAARWPARQRLPE